MLKRLAILATVVTSLTLVPAAQAAPFLVGGISLSSIGVGPGKSPVVPVTLGGASLTDFTTATALDFTDSGIATPGVAGGFKIDGTTGHFDVLHGLTGTIKDFAFVGSGNSNYPGVPVPSFQQIISEKVFSFDLQTVNVQNRDKSILTLTGTGLFHLTGYESTMGTFFFSANTAGSTFSYSASEGDESRPSIPEPAVLVLFGMGLFGLGVIRRRTMR